MFNLGVPELILILVIGLVVFGPKKLPEIGRSVGKGLKEFKKAMNDIKQTIDLESEFKEVAEIKKEVSDIKSGLKDVILNSASTPSAAGASTPQSETASATDDVSEEDSRLSWVNNSPEWRPDWAAELEPGPVEEDLTNSENTVSHEEAELTHSVVPPTKKEVLQTEEAVPIKQDDAVPHKEQITV